MAKRKPKEKLEHIREFLPKLFKKHKFWINFDDKWLQEMWQQVIGNDMYLYSRPMYIKDGMLFVKVTDSSWMQQLEMLREDILIKIRNNHSKMGVDSIQFKLGEIPHTAKDANAFSFEYLPLQAKEKKFVEESVSKIDNTELKEILKRVVSKGIIRKRLLDKKNSH
ncbi:MAG: DUF721 domain-containing protein [Deltaproteobacteria bacterium]